jgi:hypothetical protein
MRWQLESARAFFPKFNYLTILIRITICQRGNSIVGERAALPAFRGGLQTSLAEAKRTPDF